jgi:hypothetical protein
MNIEHERTKLTATFYNNIAVGAAIAGLAFPYLALYSSLILNFKASIDNLLLGFRPEALLGMRVLEQSARFVDSEQNRLIGNLDENDE